MAVFGILMLAGISFAPQGPSGPEWSVYRQTCCQGMVAEGLTNSVYNSLYYVRIGDVCDFPYMPYDPETLYLETCGRGGVYSYYINVAMTCAGQEQSAECQAVKRQLYSKAAEARGMFSATKAAYLSAASQVIYANKYYLCNTVSPSVVSYDMVFYNSMYLQCMQNPIVCESYCNQN